MSEYTLGWRRGLRCVVWYETDPATGQRKRRRYSLGTADFATAQTRLGEFDRQRRLLSAPTTRTLEIIVRAYIDDRTPEISFPDRLEVSWKALQGHFANLLPEHITKATARAYCQRRQELGRSTATIWTELSMLRSALNWAYRNKWIDRVPYVWVPPKPPPRDHSLTRAEAAKLIAACRTPHVTLFVILALNTAARSGAILDLTWDRVDLQRRQIDLNPPGRIRNRKGRAVVPINDTLHQALEEARQGAETDFVIEWAGERIHSIKKGVGRAAERAGVLPCSPHVLRHTAAVWMAEGGVPMSEIATFMGHSDSRTTESVYAKYGPDYLRKAARALEGPTGS